jgi:uncharacterized membrane protein YedE/YeeE
MDVQTLRDTLGQNAPSALAAGGLLIGFAFGWTVYRTNFCTMGSISDFMSFGDYRRFRSWMLAAAVALAGTQLLSAAGAVDLSKSMYLSANFNWFGDIVGGLLFGFGMVLTGGCASKNLARLGGGDLRALVILMVTGLFAYIAIGGVLGSARVWVEQLTRINLGTFKIDTQSFAALVAHVAGGDIERADHIISSVIIVAFAGFCFSDRSFRTSPMHIWAGLGVGLCVVAGWALTGLAFDEFNERPVAPISLTFVRPVGDTLDWLQRFTAIPMPGFGVVTVFGALLGAFVAAVGMGRFQFTTFSSIKDTQRNLIGAALMGIGGVMALGCTVGQGITGVSTLAIGSFVALISIVVGGVVGMKHMERVIMKEV